jgi:hypothetical protein
MNEREICITVDMYEIRSLRDLLTSSPQSALALPDFMPKMGKILDLIIEADINNIGKFYETE